MSVQAIQESYDLDIRRAAISDMPNVLADIYREDVNIAVWQESLNQQAIDDANTILANSEQLNLVIAATPNDIIKQLSEHSELASHTALCQHIHTLLDMFCTLFELKRAGLRLTILDKAMCPKFHVDKIPCRLVSTFSGTATEWLQHQDVDHSKLGAASVGLSDEESGVYQNEAQIQQLAAGDVALLKGSGWINNEHAGLVHRSPYQAKDQRRLVITLDFID
ncbi:DUF1826 domain-containing protein [Pseudoalteromonas piratica]|uniref:Succinylglutamate desuccinylase n=1 Tax=Pseudoalteromonas piratica TaxID=1348114 RepID=A0A0A7EIU4_9GAMM|nr:DUF1826 domain-containing protein [Pseudoalteromonas piratica]AIY66575.1 succinylglutamate desuccinylase [Pseudoalteromonas piratica]